MDSFHFIGYVPVHGRVWELDGLRSGGPLEVGEVPADGGSSGLSSSSSSWMDVVRPAIKRRMQNLLSGGSENIQFNLLAIVDGQFEKASDELEMLKRERIQLERRLNEKFPQGWKDKVRRFFLTDNQEMTPDVNGSVVVPEGRLCSLRSWPFGF